VASNKRAFYKNNQTDIIWWVETDLKGVWEFSFDRKTVFNMFQDYPWKLTPEQKSIFDRENPYWKEYFSDRQ
jgi:hypothetical protein